MRKLVATTVLGATMVVASAMPAFGAAPKQSGLVNVNVEDVVVQVPVGVAANVCGVSANVLAQEIAETGSATCDALVDQEL
jgi:hypothetical protein